MNQGKWTMQKATLLFCVGIIFFAVFFEALFFQLSFRNQIRSDVISSHETSLTKLNSDVTSYIKELQQTMLTIYNEAEYRDDLALGDPSNYKKHYWLAWYFAGKRFDVGDQLRALYLYDCNDRLISSYRFNVMELDHNLYSAQYDTNIEVLQDYVQGDRVDLLISGYDSPGNGERILRLVQKLYSYDAKYQQGRDVIGYIVCDFSVSNLLSLMEKYVDVSQAYLWMQPEGDRAIASTGVASASQKKTQGELSDMIEKKEFSPDSLNKEYDGSFLIYNTDSSLNLGAYTLVSSSLMTATQKSIASSVPLIAVFLIAVAGLVAILLSHYLTWPLREMQNSIVRIKNGETDLRVNTNTVFSELETLGTEFNEMLDRIQIMAAEDYGHKMLAERTEYQMLQAQINPHFLYNTLDTMSGIANSQNCPMVSGLCTSLSAIFRYSLNVSDELSTMRQEMAHVRNYLHVMDVRNGFTIAYDYQIDADTMDDQLPRICLQPLVENAINHGLRNVRRRDKKLTISSEHSDGLLIVKISDNGIGMDASSMNRQLALNDRKRVETGKSIGILNVNARLKNLFGARYGLHIESEEGQGTTVTVTIPVLNDTPETDKEIPDEMQSQ